MKFGARLNLRRLYCVYDLPLSVALNQTMNRTNDTHVPFYWSAAT